MLCFLYKIGIEKNIMRLLVSRGLFKKLCWFFCKSLKDHPILPYHLQNLLFPKISVSFRNMIAWLPFKETKFRFLILLKRRGYHKKLSIISIFECNFLRSGVICTWRNRCTINDRLISIASLLLYSENALSIRLDIFFKNVFLELCSMLLPLNSLWVFLVLYKIDHVVKYRHALCYFKYCFLRWTFLQISITFRYKSQVMPVFAGFLSIQFVC